MASGGTMPAAMTAAMICHGAWWSTLRPGDGEGVGNLVDRAAEVEAHHQAQDDAEQDDEAPVRPEPDGEPGGDAPPAAGRGTRTSAGRRPATRPAG